MTLSLDVTVDARALVGHRTGIGVHTAEIARRLDVEPPPLLATHAPIEDRDGLERCRFRVESMPFGVAWQQIVLPRIATGGVLWAPHATLPLSLKIPAVITLHDFTTLTMPHRHRVKTLLSFNTFIGRSLDKAARIAAVSVSVATEAMRWFGVPRSKITIVPNGVSDFFSPAGVEEEEDTILYVGTLEPRKGLSDLIDVYRSLPAPRPRLLLCGSAGWGRQPARDGIEWTGYVTRERLRELYRSAKIFVYPSEYEGFGMPPLEAMACGAPVIATRTGAIPDYATGAAVLVPPRDREALREAILGLLRNPAQRRELRAAAPAAAKHYRWETSAATMTSLLQQAAR